MGNFLMNQGRSREPVWLTCGEESVLFLLCLTAEMVWVFEPRWW